MGPSSCVHSVPAPLLQEVGSSYAHCVPLRFCRKWGPSSCVHSVLHHSYRKWGPSSRVHCVPAPLPQEMCTPLQGDSTNCKTQPPAPTELSWRSHLTNRRAPRAPMQPRLIHTTQPVVSTRAALCPKPTSAHVLCPRLLEGNDERRRLHRKSMINLDIICCVPLRVSC